MTDRIIRELNPNINMSDGTFGISLHLWELFPKNTTSMLVTIKKDGLTVEQYTLLPHQLYLEDLINKSLGGQYDVTVTPQSSEFKTINIFKEFKFSGEDEDDK